MLSKPICKREKKIVRPELCIELSLRNHEILSERQLPNNSQEVFSDYFESCHLDFSIIWVYVPWPTERKTLSLYFDIFAINWGFSPGLYDMHYTVYKNSPTEKIWEQRGGSPYMIAADHWIWEVGKTLPSALKWVLLVNWVLVVLIHFHEYS